jgi:ferrochelatase
MAGTRHLILVQLGTPQAPTADAVRVYLREFLSDPKVVDWPRWLWLPILHGIVLRTRPAKSAAAYRKIWTEDGSPLFFHSRALVQQLQAQLDDGTRVHLAMRYGEPSLRALLRELDPRELALLPLFPQYSEATTGSINVLAQEICAVLPKMLCDYHDDPDYIGCVATAAREAEAAAGGFDRWLFSYHGLPQRQANAGDPYAAQCARGAELLAAELGLSADRWEMCFQSRFGPEKWLQPATADRLARLGRDGVGKLGVICPGFAADCLETLEEIGMAGAAIFRSSGGGQLHLVPCLNSDARWASALARIARRLLA